MSVTTRSKSVILDKTVGMASVSRVGQYQPNSMLSHSGVSGDRCKAETINKAFIAQ